MKRNDYIVKNGKIIEEKDNILLIGVGEVGEAMLKLIQDTQIYFNIYIIDHDKGYKSFKKECDFDVMHINIPYSDKFIAICTGYINKFQPGLVVINSTVPVGTTRKIYEITKTDIVHSPVKGVHPKLYQGIKTFWKYVGPINTSSLWRIQRHFQKVNIKAQHFNNPEETEMAKLLSTTYYGFNITFCKDAKKLCDEKGLDFNNVYNRWNEDYNSGYRALDMGYVVRPVLIPTEGEIGGHCIISNCELLKDNLEAAYYILKRNKEYKKE